MIRVAIVDDQTLVRRGVAELIALCPDFEVAFTSGEAEEALRLLAAQPPDVLLLDVRMPEMDGLELLGELNAKRVRVPTIMLTTFDDDAALLRAIELGAKGFLLKDTTLEDLSLAIRTVVAGGSALRPAVTERARRALGEIRGMAPVSGCNSLGLTDREREVLGLLGGGFTNQQIARALKVAEGTVKNHVSNILAKLGVHDRTRAVLKGLELGLI
jgi:DNA-binding NarL/FixJ family response regulator